VERALLFGLWWRGGKRGKRSSFLEHSMGSSLSGSRGKSETVSKVVDTRELLRGGR